MPVRRPASDHLRPGGTVMRRPTLARMFAGATIATLCVALAPIQATAAGTGVDPATYVHSACTTLGSFTTQLTSLQTSTNLSNATTLADVRDKLVSFLNQAATLTTSTVADLRNDGSPNIKDGDKYAALIVKEIASLRDAYAKAASSAQALNTSNVTAFKKLATTIGKRITAAGDKASRVLADAKKRYNLKALIALQAQDPSCQGVR
jgi:hypothetical protein